MSTQTSLDEWQTAVYAAFTGDTGAGGLMTLIPTGAVFDFGAVPTSQAFPYITLGDNTEGPMNAFARRGYLTRALIHVWDNSQGFHKCRQILARMNFLIDQKLLTMTSQTMVYTLYQQAHLLNDPGLDDLRHLVAEYEIFTQE